IVKVNGGTTDGTNDIEACLDIETILGQANNAHVFVYECPNDGSLDTFLQMATDNVPILSDSWTGDEKQIYDYKDDQGVYEGRDYMTAFHTIMETMIAQGQGLFNSSGDRGAFNAVNGVRSIAFPGNDPDVTTVGGTSLYGDSNGFWQSEKGWGGSGG